MGRVFTAYRKKHLLTAIATLSDMMRDAWDHDPRKTSHAAKTIGTIPPANIQGNALESCVRTSYFDSSTAGVA